MKTSLEMTQKLNLIILNKNLQSSYKVYGTDATTISLQIRSRQGRPAPESRQVESERVGKAAFLSCDKRKTTRWDVNNLAPNWICFLTAFFFRGQGGGERLMWFCVWLKLIGKLFLRCVSVSINPSVNCFKYWRNISGN